TVVVGPLLISPITVRPRTDLPDPDSPTRPRVSPGAMAKETPSTARTSPRGVWKTVRRSSTTSRGAAPVRADEVAEALAGALAGALADESAGVVTAWRSSGPSASALSRPAG